MMRVEQIGDATLYVGSMEAVLPALPADSFDSVVCDPPYGLKFMGKQWDYDVPTVAQWQEVFRVLKPGGHVLAFGGTRTYHRLVCAVEDAGFEVRDMVSWVYGSGFPKSLDVSKAIDKAAGAEREVVGENPWTNSKMEAGNGVSGIRMAGSHAGEYEGARVRSLITAPATEAARQWAGWGTALKPAVEPCVLARKPLIGTVAENVLRYGTGAINVDGCRVAGEPRQNDAGRFPANLIHDGSLEVVGLFPDSRGQQGDVRGTKKSHTGGAGTNCYGEYGRVPAPKRGDSGSAARFFYCAKASRAERADSKHPTVKPVDLMRYLCRLITPPGGVILDSWAGSGTTGEAAVLEGFRVVLIERDAANEPDIRHRLERSQRQGRLFVGEPTKPERVQMFNAF